MYYNFIRSLTQPFSHCLRFAFVLGCFFLQATLFPVSLFAQLEHVRYFPSASSTDDIRNLYWAGGTLYFTYKDPFIGEELWKSDGTESGTALVYDINYGSSSAFPSELTRIGSTVYFAASSSKGRELWKTEGTPGSTVMVKDIYPNLASSDPRNLINYNNTLYFTANDGTHGRELWKSDGTIAGTVLVKDIVPGAVGSAPEFPIVMNGVLYFAANGNLYKSDGTAAGTVLVQDLPYGISSPFTIKGNKLYFSVYAYEHQNKQVWQSDGTPAGTVKIKDIMHLRPGAVTTLSSFTTVGNTIFFVSKTESPSFGVEYRLWKTDGTEAGTVNVYFIGSYPYQWNYNPNIGIHELVSYQGSLYMSVNNGVYGQELWRSDGTPAGTVLVADINSGSASSETSELKSVGWFLYFSANDGSTGQELYRSSGVIGSYTQLYDLNWGIPGSFPRFLTPTSTFPISIKSQYLYFTATAGSVGRSIWRYKLPTIRPRFPKDPFPRIPMATAREGIAEEQSPEVSGLNINLFPNPVIAEQFSIQLNVPASSVTATEVTDLTGRLLLLNPHQIQGEKQLLVRPVGIKPGTYLIKVSSRFGQQAVRFNKQ